jgi:hypothetical protein
MENPGQRITGGTPWRFVIFAALVLTALNVVKPIHEDDPVYLCYAIEFSAHPFHPYGFEFGSPYASSANNLLVPPVLPYWIGAGARLLGKHPILLKCWLFPIALLLAWAVDFHAARLAPSLRTPLFWLALLSPTLVPGFNLMLDLPVLALGLAALALAMRAVERSSWSLALLSGLITALAIQTKYTGIIACAAIVVWCAMRRDTTRGAFVAGLAIALAVGWELLILYTQGESHFVVHLQQRQGHVIQRCLHLLLPLVSHLAGLAPVAALLGLAALGWSPRNIVLIGLGMLATVMILALVPSQSPVLLVRGKPIVTPSNLVYALLAIPVWTAVVGVCVHLARRRASDEPDRQLDRFLLLWLALELASYFALSPFPAARRVLGLLLVFTLAAGRLAHLRGVKAQLVSKLALCGAAFSALFFVTDLFDARAEQKAAREVARRANLLADGGTFWNLTWGGLSYHTEHDGIRPLQINRHKPRPGDLLAVYDIRELREVLEHTPEVRLELLDTVLVDDGFPLRASPGYYSGRTPLENHREARICIRIYRITAVLAA